MNRLSAITKSFLLSVLVCLPAAPAAAQTDDHSCVHFADLAKMTMEYRQKPYRIGGRYQDDPMPKEEFLRRVDDWAVDDLYSWSKRDIEMLRLFADLAWDQPHEGWDNPHRIYKRIEVFKEKAYEACTKERSANGP